MESAQTLATAPSLTVNGLWPEWLPCLAGHPRRPAPHSEGAAPVFGTFTLSLEMADQ